MKDSFVVINKKRNFMSILYHLHQYESIQFFRVDTFDLDHHFIRGEIDI